MDTPSDKKKAAIARAAKHVTSQLDTEITEVIEKDEDRNVSISDRLAGAAAMFFGSAAAFLVIAGFIILVSAKAGAGAFVILGYKGYGIRVVAALVGLFTVGAFVRPNLALRMFGYFMNGFNEAFRRDGFR